MTNICKDCRFFETEECKKYNIKVSESFIACNDFFNKTVINESTSIRKIQLND